MRTFLNEALTMREFRHQHVLQLIGIVIDCDKMPLVILPFMTHGDLLSYIRDDNNVRSPSPLPHHFSDYLNSIFVPPKALGE